MIKPKIMDFDTDWEFIKETQLKFLVEEEVNVNLGAGDQRYAGIGDKPAGPPVDPREGILRALVGVALGN